MKVPPKRKGNFAIRKRLSFCRETLNESPSEKEGKSRTGWVASPPVGPSMKVPPKRKGNLQPHGEHPRILPSMKVPPKRKGNCSRPAAPNSKSALNESPSEKEGKFVPGVAVARIIDGPSMKVPPKRKGNAIIQTSSRLSAHTLNESPSEKEGKSLTEKLAPIISSLPQ